MFEKDVQNLKGVGLAKSSKDMKVLSYEKKAKKENKNIKDYQ